MVVVSNDPGMKGYFAVFRNGRLLSTRPIPLKKHIVKPATYKYKHTNPKILIKTGPNKGLRAKVIYRKEKSHSVQDFEVIVSFMRRLSNTFIDDIHFIGEAPYVIPGAASSAKKVYSNYAKSVGIAYANGFKINEVTPSVWKKKLGVTSEKETSIALAKQLYPEHAFKSHDECEAVLVGHYYINFMYKGK